MRKINRIRDEIAPIIHKANLTQFLNAVKPKQLYSDYGKVLQKPGLRKIL